MSNAAIYDSQTGLEFGGKESEDDRGLLVFFHLHPVFMRAASEKAGRQIYEDRVYVHIESPANKSSIVDREAKPADFQRFPTRHTRNARFWLLAQRCHAGL